MRIDQPVDAESPVLAWKPVKSDMGQSDIPQPAEDSSRSPWHAPQAGQGGERHPQPERSAHQPVLVNDVLEYLAPQPGAVMVDCTVGAGGHSLRLLPRLLPTGRLIAIDRDPEALALARQRLMEFHPQIEFVQGDFRHLSAILARLGLSTVDGVVADLGMSSVQVDRPERGFSFLREGPLDMRMDSTQPTTAASLVNRLPESELAQVIRRYGEERWASRIAKRIVTARRTQPIQTTSQLARIVAEAIPSGHRSYRIHPATRTFQALRIAVNDELGSLQALLEFLPEALNPGGRAAIIAFHSLEDRLVKQSFRQGAEAGIVRLLTKKPVRPPADEQQDNPRSRSAKLRAVERC